MPRQKRTIGLTFFFLIFNVRGQDDVNIIDAENESSIKLCDMCTCSEIPDIDGTPDLVLNIQCSELDRIKNVPDLDKIVWPVNPNGLKISATFEGLGISTLGKLPSNPQVTNLRFINNAITTYWPDPFSDVSNLKKLSFYQNELQEVTPDLFTKIDQLEELDLSFNKLSNFNSIDFTSLQRLKRLNLQNNQLKKIPLEVLQPMSTLEDLDLSKNGIYDLLLQRSYGDTLKNIKRLNLSGNRIRSIMKDSLPTNNSIELLDLSNNIIELVENEAFISCTSLRELNLAQNNITLVFALPATLQILILKLNTMFHWPQLPSGITYVDMSYNRLTALYDEKNVNEYKNLEFLNIAGNQINELNFTNRLQQLFNLDLSYNLLNEIPGSLNTLNFPNLEELRLDGNPISSIYFKNIISLKRLYMNELHSLMVIEDKAFTNVFGRNIEEGAKSQKSCISLYLSNCQSLREIKEGAFDGTSVCMLDISKNNLTSLSKNLLDWQAVSDGVDLQWNPWDCTCEMQWVLDELMPRLYQSHPLFLAELRCATPRALDGIRFVHLYNWTDHVMCTESFTSIEGRRLDYSVESSRETSSFPVPKLTTMNIILMSCIIVLTIVAVILTVYILATRKRYSLWRRTMKRKRQTKKDINGTDKDQFASFNKA